MTEKDLPAILERLERTSPDVQLYLLTREMIQVQEDRRKHAAELLRLANENERLKAAAEASQAKLRRAKKAMP